MIKDAKTSEKIMINNEERTVVINGNYMITNYDQHPDMDKIKKIFTHYQAD